MDIDQTTILKIVHASENIKCEYITNAFHIQVLVITSIKLRDNYSDKIDFALPNTLKKLILGNKTNGPITLPNSLELFHMRNYDKLIFLPKNLKILYINVRSNYKMHLPEKLTFIVFHNCTIRDTHLMWYMDNLPDSVKTIHIENPFPWMNIPQSIESIVMHSDLIISRMWNNGNELHEHTAFKHKILRIKPNISFECVTDPLFNNGKLLFEHLK